jgi:hypothetical protein
MGFLLGIPGVFEHIYTISATIHNAKELGKPLYMTFIDIASAFPRHLS